MPSIVLTAINTLRNRGVEALALSILEGVRTEFGPKAQITLLTRDVKGAQESLSHRGITDVTILPDSAYAPKVEAGTMDKLTFKAKRALRMQVLKKLTSAEQALADADLVLVSGGDVFSSDYGIMERYLRQYDQPIANGTPVYFLAQSIGPFTNPDEKASFTEIAKKSWFTVRETISEKYLIEDLGIPAERVKLSADPAFLLTVPDEVQAEMMAEYGLEPGGYATAAVSRGISEFKGLSHEEHLEAWLVAARGIIARAGKLVLVPHVQLPQSEEDDLSLANEIAAALDDPNCVVMNRLHSSVEFKSVLKGSVFCIAERTHGAIGAMSSNVPTLSVGYSIKARGILQLLLEDPELFSTLHLPVEKFTAENAEAVVAAAWDARDRFAEELSRTLPETRARAKDNYVTARALIETGKLAK